MFIKWSSVGIISIFTLSRLYDFSMPTVSQDTRLFDAAGLSVSARLEARRVNDWSRPLFSKPRSVAAASIESPRNLTGEPLPVLLGVIGSVSERLAVLRDQQGAVFRLREGHKKGGWTVVAVDARSVIVEDIAGSRQKLQLK